MSPKKTKLPTKADIMDCAPLTWLEFAWTDVDHNTVGLLLQQPKSKPGLVPLKVYFPDDGAITDHAYHTQVAKILGPVLVPEVSGNAPTLQSKPLPTVGSVVYGKLLSTYGPVVQRDNGFIGRVVSINKKNYHCHVKFMPFAKIVDENIKLLKGLEYSVTFDKNKELLLMLDGRYVVEHVYIDAFEAIKERS